MRRHFRWPAGGQRGITGLETAIILIAFVVVASVFAFTVLSTGVFSSERSKEALYAGIEQARSSLAPRGSAVAFRGAIGGTQQSVYKISFVVANATAGDPIDLTPPYALPDTPTDATPVFIPNSDYKTVITYIDDRQFIPDIPWTVNFLGTTDPGQTALNPGQAAEITVWLLQLTDGTDPATAEVWTGPDANGAHGILLAANALERNNQFTLEVKPPRGSVMSLQRTLPPDLSAVMNLR